MLARGVDSHPGKRHAETVLRSGVQNVRRPAGGAETRHERSAPVQHPEDVHGEDPLHVVGARLRDEVRQPDARVVAEHVDAAERRPRALGERFDRRRLGDVTLHREAADSPPLELARNLLRTRRVHVGDDDVTALGRERAGDAAADPARSPSDDGDTVFHVVHAISGLPQATANYAPVASDAGGELRPLPISLNSLSRSWIARSR